MASTLFDLSGKGAVITGGSRGLGKAMARGFAEAGANVLITSRHEDELRPAVEDIRKGLSVKVEYMVCDMTDLKQVDALAQTAVAKLGQKPDAIAYSLPNVELTWRFGPTEVKEAETYAEHMLALKQIKRLPDFTTFFDTRFVEAMEKKV